MTKLDSLDGNSLIQKYGKEQYSRYVAIISVIIEWIEEGIKTSDGYRAFTLDDCKKLLKLDISEAWEICKIEFNSDKQELFNIFFDIYDEEYNRKKRREFRPHSLKKSSSEDIEHKAYVTSMGYKHGLVNRVKRRNY